MNISKRKCIFPSCRVEHKIGQAVARQLSKEKDTNADDRTTTKFDDKEREPTQNMAMLSSTKRKERSRRVEETNMDETSSKEENAPFSRVSNFPLLSKHLS